MTFKHQFKTVRNQATTKNAESYLKKFFIFLNPFKSIGLMMLLRFSATLNGGVTIIINMAYVYTII